MYVFNDLNVLDFNDVLSKNEDLNDETAFVLKNCNLFKTKIQEGIPYFNLEDKGISLYMCKDSFIFDANQNNFELKFKKLKNIHVNYKKLTIIFEPKVGKEILISFSLLNLVIVYLIEQYWNNIR